MRARSIVPALVLLGAFLLLAPPTSAAPAFAKATPRPTKTFIPMITSTPTRTSTPTPTRTSTWTSTPTLTRTSTRTSTPTQTPTQTPTASRTPTRTPTQTPTLTPTQTPTASLTPTQAPPTATPDPANPHGSITAYDGPQTCIACHATEAESALHSEHMKWDGKWQQVNTYCTSPAPADYACLSCHASTGKVTNQTVNDVDCLICHSDTYQRSLQPLDIPVTVTDWQGNSKTYMTPRKNAEGNYTMQPRFDLMPPGTTMVSLAQNVHLPTRATCLRCHAGAGGGDGVKRGDISKATINPSLTSDVHMSPQGGDFTCQTCHVTTDHQIPGKGIDLRISEGGAVKSCADCHDAKPHDSSRLDQHTDRVACQTCHIPTFAKDVATEMSRDWTHPTWNPAACSGQGGWVGEEVKASNVVPQYAFWNGTSYVYDLAQSISAQPDGSYAMAKANGGINDVASKLYPIKLHQAVQPRHDATGRMVQYDVLWNFMTGKYQEAATRGVAFMGLTGSSSWVNTTAEQLITHGVESSDNALACANCHESNSRMDLSALGYTLKGSTSTVCTQCHGPKEVKPFYDLHNKHVTDKRLDCSWCHTFTRPERGLRLP